MASYATIPDYCTVSRHYDFGKPQLKEFDKVNFHKIAHNYTLQLHAMKVTYCRVVPHIYLFTESLHCIHQILQCTAMEKCGHHNVCVHL